MSDTDFDTLFDDKARAAHAAGPVGYDEEGVRQAVRLFLKSIGEDPDREGLLDTPDRIGRACKELFAGLGHRPQVQERLTQQVADALMEGIDARGVIVVTECDHMCMAMRGVKKAQSRTVTSAVRGCMRDAATRTEAMSLILSNHS